MPRAFIKIAAALILLTFCGSCGYRAHDPICSKSVMVSMVQGDEYGTLTNEIIRKLSESSHITYFHSKADYILKVQVLKLCHETVGYRKDREKDFTKRENIIASEGRLKVHVCATLIDAHTCDTCFGPIEIAAYTDYDYVDENSLEDLSFINQAGQRTTVLDFSLGQLESEESARFAAYSPLFKKLAEKIIDVISIQW